MKQPYFIILLACFLLFSKPVISSDALVGWAACTSLGQNSTTGGGNGQIVRVTTKAALEQYAKATADFTIIVEGNFSGTGMVEVGSNKTIIGAGNGATFDGFGINVNGKKNIILRNLTIKNAKPDGIAMRNTHHVWIDHCDLSNSDDGLLDFTIGSDYMTVSWTIFHDHDKVTLANSGTQHFEDAGKNKVCYHHNWFNNTVQRNPRVGYGLGHVFNNYYSGVSSYCVGYHTGASVLVENNYFYKSNSPLNQMYTGVSTAANYADAEEKGNIFDNTSGNTKGTGKSYNTGLYYNYAFMLDAASNLPTLIKGNAGPKSGMEYEYLPVPGNGSIDVTNLNELWWTNIENVQSWEVLFGTNPDSLIKTSSTSRTYYPEMLKPDTEYFWKVNAIKKDTTIEGKLWRFRTAPSKASKPFPVNGEQHAILRQANTDKTTIPVVLSWTPAFKAASYKVYFDTIPDFNTSNYKTSTNPSFAPGPLKYGVNYYWRVDVVLSDNSIIEGETWNFKSDVRYSQEGITECENMVLNARAFKEEQSGVWFKASNNWVVSGEAGPGTMSSVWKGPNAICSVSVNHFDESDGNGWYGFYINEKIVKSWNASTNNDKMVTYTMDNVQIQKNDELRIEFYTNSGELNRTDLMNIKITKNLDNPTHLTYVKDYNYPPNQDLKINIYLVSGQLIETLVVRTDSEGKLPLQFWKKSTIPSGMYIYTIKETNLQYRSFNKFIK
jgi:pectate lyase